ncbi:MAG: hypothetical protein JOZ15_19600 [Acidobacteria bacterium]|nr:hypothetical protein [Acidobacteriota bacterium]
MAEIQWQPLSPNWREAAAGDAREAREAAAARRQGAIGGAVGLAVAAALAFLLHRAGVAVAVAAASLAVAALALAAPLTLYRRLRGALDRFAGWVGTAVTWLLMTLLFYLLFLPAGLILRATGKLTFTRFADPTLATYWTATEDRVHGAESYRKQF